MSDLDVRMVVLEGVARQAKGSTPTAKWRQLWRDAIAPFGPEEVRFWCRLQWEKIGRDEVAESTLMASFWGIAAVATHGTAAQLADWAWKLHKADAHKFANAAIQALAAIASGSENPNGEPDMAIAEAPTESQHELSTEEIPHTPVLADDAIGHLQRLKSRIRHRVTAKRIDQALMAVAASRGLSAEALQDLVVEDADLAEDGSRSWPAGPHDLYLFITDDGDVELAIFERATGRAVGGPPKSLKTDHYGVYNEAKAVQKILAESLSTQKVRLEQALESQRSWTWPAWQQVFGRHPLMRHLAMRLIWTVWLEGKMIDTAAFNGEELVDRADDHVRVPAKGELTLLHPAQIDPEALRGWQHHVVSRRLIQPFKQVFRETYAMPTGEEASRRSERFAGQVVRHRQMYALLRGRGWSGLAGIGPAGYHGLRELPGHGLTALVAFHQFRHYPDKQRRQVTLDGIEFYPLPLPEWQPGAEQRLAFSAVSPVAYSEVMRDIALVVGVAGQGDEAELRDTEDPRPARSARRAPEVLLGGIAEMRASLVRELLPLLGLENQVQIEGHYALITGSGRDFRMHLGSGEVSLVSDGRKLDLDGIERTDTPLYLPYEGSDAATLAILSTLLFLARFGQSRS